MSSSSKSTPSPSRKRPIVKSEEDDSPSPTPSPSKKPRVTTSGKTKSDAWTSDDRLQLFEAYQACAQIKWDEVAAKMGGGKGATACRDQWNRATGKKIKKALGERD